MTTEPAYRTVGLLLIGNELLSGKVRDANGELVIHELRRVGADLREIRVVADDPALLRDALRALSERYDAVITSGGVGPTHDDVTLGAVADAFDAPLEEDPSLLERIRGVFGGDEESFRVWSRMATVPRGCTLVLEDGMRWPVHRLGNVWILPGVPQIFERQFRAVVHHFASRPVTVRTILLTLGEGRVAEPLSLAVERFPDVEFGSYPVLQNDRYRTRVTVEGRDPSQVASAVEVLGEHFGDAVVEVIAGDTTTP